MQMQYKFVYRATARSLNWTPADEPQTSVDTLLRTTNDDCGIYGNVGSAADIEEYENSESNIYANIPRAECTNDDSSPANGGDNLYANFNETINMISAKWSVNVF